MVPLAWSADYPSLSQRVTQPDVIIDPVSEDGFGNSPYAKHFDECGRSGEYIHFTDEYILNSTIQAQYGDPGKSKVFYVLTYTINTQI